MAVKATKNTTITEQQAGTTYARRRTSIDAAKNVFQQFQPQNPYYREAEMIVFHPESMDKGP